MMDFYQVWRSGKTVRMHTAPQLHRENIAEHTWGVLLAIVRYYPFASADLLRGVIAHDCGEQKTGDLPGNVKWANEALGSLVEDMEKKHVAEMGLSLGIMTRADVLFLEVFDRLDFAMSCIHEMRLGNMNSALYFTRSVNKAESTLEQLRVRHKKEANSTELPDMIRAGEAFLADVRELRHTYLHHIPREEFNERLG